MTVTADSLDSEAFNLAQIAQSHHVVSSIIYGSITEVTNRPLGNVVVEMTSTLPDPDGTAAIEELLVKLDKDGIRLTDLGTASEQIDDPTWTELIGEES